MADFFQYIMTGIHSFGYIGIFLATALEYACFPLSSEILLPFIGYSVYTGQLSLPITVIAATIGGATGCSFCYGVGRFGREILEQLLCRSFPALKEGMEKADAYFNRLGGQSVFFGRMMPIVRTYISFPAGMAKMRYSKFLCLSTLGALVWNTALISLGYVMGEHWASISCFFTENKIPMILIVFFLVFLVLRKKLKVTFPN